MSKASNVIFINEANDIKTGLFCNLCEYILKTTEDVKIHDDHGCCKECWLTFGESRKDDWEKGWRPDNDTLHRYKEERRILNRDIFKLLEV